MRCSTFSVERSKPLRRRMHRRCVVTFWFWARLATQRTLASSSAGFITTCTSPGALSSSRLSAPVAIASMCPSALNASALTAADSTYCRIRFLATGSQSAQCASPPPVANVPYRGSKASAWIGNTTSSPSTSLRWHLKAYFCAWPSGLGSKNSTAMRPSIEEVA